MSKNNARRRRQQARQRQNYLFWVVGGSLILLAIAAIALLNREPAPETTSVPVEKSGNPSLRVDREEIDLGSVPVDQMVKASFKVSNAGDQPLTLAIPPVAEVLEGC